MITGRWSAIGALCMLFWGANAEAFDIKPHRIFLFNPTPIYKTAMEACLASYTSSPSGANIQGYFRSLTGYRYVQDSNGNDVGVYCQGVSAYYGDNLVHDIFPITMKYSCDDINAIQVYNGQICNVDLYKNQGISNESDGNLCADSKSPSVGNPIILRSGNKFQQESDYSPDPSSLSFERFYNSMIANREFVSAEFPNIDVQALSSNMAAFRNIWGHTYQRNIITQTDWSVTKARVQHANGSETTFYFSNNAWVGDADSADKLIELKDPVTLVRTGWSYFNAYKDETELYDASNKLIFITNRAGLVQTLTYNPDGSLAFVSDQLGHNLTFGYDSLKRMVSLTDLAGNQYIYNYDVSVNKRAALLSVTYPGNSIRTYHYENATFKNALTGITDENASRYATWGYDTQGRSVSSEHAGVVDKFTIQYTTFISNANIAAYSAAVTNPRSSVRTYTFSAKQGVLRLTNQTQPAGAGCAASASALTYDSNANIATSKDFNGYITSYVYDLARNLETSRTEGKTSGNGVIAGVTRTITTSWHATWHLPLVIKEYSGGANASGVPTSSTPLKTTTYSYDAKGNLASFAVTDPALGITRTTTITNTYSTVVPGLLVGKVVDGPRTDISDITTYSFYPHDASCVASTGASTITNLGCRGQLQSITDAMGFITQYTRYNHHGQLEESIDPNGLVSTNTYDVRQRLTSHTIGTETTSLTYDGVGQITLLTLPDNSTLSYIYDPAHRLTDIQDTLGNKVHYTLDSEGNRTAENTYDPLGNLSKTLTRSYDALSRLQQLTGVQ